MAGPAVTVSMPGTMGLGQFGRGSAPGALPLPVAPVMTSGIKRGASDMGPGASVWPPTGPQNPSMTFPMGKLAGMPFTSGVITEHSNVAHTFRGWLNVLPGGWEELIAPGNLVWPIRSMAEHDQPKTSASQSGNFTSGQFIGVSVPILNAYLDQSTHPRFAFDVGLSESLKWAWPRREAYRDPRERRAPLLYVPDPARLRSMIGFRPFVQVTRPLAYYDNEMPGRTGHTKSSRARTVPVRLFAISGDADMVSTPNIWGYPRQGDDLYVYPRYFAPGLYPYDAYIDPDGTLIPVKNTNAILQMWPVVYDRVHDGTIPDAPHDPIVRPQLRAGERAPRLAFPLHMQKQTPRGGTEPVGAGGGISTDPRVDLDFINVDGTYEFGQLIHVGKVMKTPQPYDITSNLRCLRDHTMYNTLPHVQIALGA